MNNDYNNNQQITYEDLTSKAPEAQTGTVSPKTCLILGIIAADIAALGIPGIILGAIGLSKSNKFISEHGGKSFGMAKVGHILSKVGIGLGIAMTVVWAVYAIGMGAFIYSAVDGAINSACAAVRDFNIL